MKKAVFIGSVMLLAAINTMAQTNEEEARVLYSKAVEQYEAQQFQDCYKTLNDCNKKLGEPTIKTTYLLIKTVSEGIKAWSANNSQSNTYPDNYNNRLWLLITSKALLGNVNKNTYPQEKYNEILSIKIDAEQALQPAYTKKREYDQLNGNEKALNNTMDSLLQALADNANKSTLFYSGLARKKDKKNYSQQVWYDKNNSMLHCDKDSLLCTVKPWKIDNSYSFKMYCGEKCISILYIDLRSFVNQMENFLQTSGFRKLHNGYYNDVKGLYLPDYVPTENNTKNDAAINNYKIGRRFEMGTATQPKDLYKALAAYQEAGKTAGGFSDHVTRVQLKIYAQRRKDSLAQIAKNMTEAPAVGLAMGNLMARAEFPGGDKALADYLSKNLYIFIEPDNRLKGKIIVAFFVEPDGTCAPYSIDSEDHDLKFYMGNNPKGYTHANSIMDLFETMPLWKPATQNGKKVKSVMKIPIVFDE